MIKSALVEMYNRTIQTYNREPKDGEFDAWMNVIGSYKYSDVDAALRRWQHDTTLEEYTNRPRGSRMPSATELKASIEAFDRGQTRKFVPCGKDGCEDGWIRVYSGITAGGNQVDPKIGAVKRCQCFRDYVSSRKAS